MQPFGGFGRWHKWPAYHASIPINAHGKKLGILNLASTDWRELSAEDLRLFYTIGDMLGIAIERNRLVQQSRHLGCFKNATAWHVRFTIRWHKD